MATLFVASYPKSGNTWVRLLFTFYVSGAYDLNKLARHSPHEVAYALWRQVGALTGEADGKTREEIQRIRVDAHRRVHNDSRIWVLKTHSVPGIPGMDPEIRLGHVDRAILVVRDPRDVAVSYAHYTGKPVEEIVELLNSPMGGILDTAGDVVQAPYVLTDWSMHYQLWKIALECSERPHVTVRYEDLVQAPLATFTEILSKILTDEMIDLTRVQEAVEATEFTRLQEHEREHGFIGAVGHSPFFREGRVGQWRDELDGELVEALEAKHRRVMRELGYVE